MQVNNLARCLAHSVNITYYYYYPGVLFSYRFTGHLSEAGRCTTGYHEKELD